MIAQEHSNNTFGYLTKEDLENEIWIICLDIISEFNNKTGTLEHFLRVAVKNRLINKFKEVTKSIRTPCSRCPFYDSENKVNDCMKFEDAGTESEPLENRHQCDKWKKYQISLDSRNSLLMSVEHKYDVESYVSPYDNLIYNELWDEIKAELSEEEVDQVNKLVNGIKLPKATVSQLQEKIIEILNA